ncbi:MAG TPA: Ig-like domain-containing protein, partial [Vicinamibacterales bacterium]|nr:Ig-like domain-containing protein [Vicinamibacterales bacterium]
MIPDERPHRVPRSAGRRVCRAAVLIVLSSVLAIQACDKVALVAPTGTTITLYTNSQFLAVNGTADITASVIEANGYPVQNGTTVTFTTSLGTVEPSDAKTHDGKATVKLLIGTAAVGQVLVSATPPTVPATGGTVQIVATVQDTGGNNLLGVPVNFTTDFGTLVPDTAVSDSNGNARTVLTTSQSATVTATAGAKNATAKVTALAVPTITITPPSTTPSVGVPASFTINVTAGANSSPITDVTVDFGEGRPVSLGAVNGSITVSHTYDVADDYTVTVTARDATGVTA